MLTFVHKNGPEWSKTYRSLTFVNIESLHSKTTKYHDIKFFNILENQNYFNVLKGMKNDNQHNLYNFKIILFGLISFVHRAGCLRIAEAGGRSVGSKQIILTVQQNLSSGWGGGGL